MFQSIKRRTVGLSAARGQPVSQEFETTRKNLDSISKALSAALGEIDAAEKEWKAIVKSTDHFSATISSLYPLDDDVRTLFRTTAEQVQGTMPKEVEAAAEATSNVRGMERMVRAYLTEIKTLSAEYTKVDHARRDYAMNQAKVDKMSKKDGQNDKQSKNLDRLESTKAQYTSILDGTVHRMKTTYDKAPNMFRAAFVAYWLYQSKVHSIVGNHCGPAHTYAKTHAESLFKMSESAQHPILPGAPSK